MCLNPTSVSLKKTEKLQNKDPGEVPQQIQLFLKENSTSFYLHFSSTEIQTFQKTIGIT